MAGRIRKKGFEYFTCDVNFYQDIKIRKVIRRKGIQGVSIYHILLCKIYEKGYYLEWDEDLPFSLFEISGIEEDTVIDIINYCMEIGLFNLTLFQNDNILTSRAIQQRYFDMTVAAKRKPEDSLPYLLVDAGMFRSVKTEQKPISEEKDLFSSEQINNNSEEMLNNSEEIPQSKVKESKEKNKEDANASMSSPATTDDDDRVNLLAFMDFFNKTMQSYNAQIPTITQITSKRKKAINARVREFGKESLRTVTLNAARSDYLNGSGKDAFVASFDWIMRPNNFPKVLEGNFNHDISPSVNSKSDTYGTSNTAGRSDKDLVNGAINIALKLQQEAESGVDPTLYR